MSTDTTDTTEEKKPASTPPAAEPPKAEEPKKEEAKPATAAATGYQPAPLSIPPPSKKKKKAKDVEVAIRLTKVVKRFGVKTAVDGVTFKVKAGSVYGLIGPNGAGKTTTFSMLAGFLKPTEGELEVLGYEPTNVDELRSRIGVLPQDALLPQMDKVGEFLLHMARLQDMDAADAEEAARNVLAEVDGRDWWGVKCGALSHGMAKRVQLAQALLGDPEIVLLDEPTAGLDPAGREEMLALVARLGTFGISVLMATHLLDDVQQVCDHVLMIDGGQLVVSGPTDALLERTGVVTVDVGGIAGAERLLAELITIGMKAEVIEGVVEATVEGDDDLDRVRDVIAQLQLPLYRLGSRLTSLDEVFVQRARHR